MLKETIYWTFGGAFVLLFNINKVSENESYLRQTFLNIFKLMIVIEFLVNLHPFKLIVELITLPVILFFTMISVFSENKEENRSVKRVADSLLAIYGILVLIFSIYYVSKDLNSFATLSNLESFLLGPILTVLFLPFIYITALVMTYESYFAGIKWILKENKETFKFTKWNVLKSCNFNLSKIQLVSKNLHIYTSVNKSEILNDLRKILKK